MAFHGHYAADDDAEQKTKKKLRTAGVEARLALGSKSNFVDNAERVKKTNKVQSNGSYAPKENNTRDSKEVNMCDFNYVFQHLTHFTFCSCILSISLPACGSRFKSINDALSCGCRWKFY